MKITTQIIDKIEDVRAGDILLQPEKEERVAMFITVKDVYDTHGKRREFNECTVVRLVLEAE